MIKRFIAIGSISVCLFLFSASIYGGNVKSQWKNYRFEDFGFQVQSPWSLERQNEEKESLILSASADDNAINVVVFAKLYSKEGIDLPEIRDTMVAIFIKAGCHNFRIVDKTTVCGSVPALLTTGTYEPPNSRPRAMRMLSLKKGPRWWVVAVNYATGNNVQTVNAAKIIKSFHLEI